VSLHGFSWLATNFMMLLLIRQWSLLTAFPLGITWPYHRIMVIGPDVPVLDLQAGLSVHRSDFSRKTGNIWRGRKKLCFLLEVFF